MALVNRDASPSIDASTAMYAAQITGKLAGQNLDAGAAVYIKASDGKVYMANGAQAGAAPTAAEQEAATFIGIVPRAALAGQPVTVFSLGCRLRYGAGLAAGDQLYVAATAGPFDDAASALGTVVVARVIDDTDIMITNVP